MAAIAERAAATEITAAAEETEAEKLVGKVAETTRIEQQDGLALKTAQVGHPVHTTPASRVAS